jgi:signal transduction histidine kinase/CheY-like chemotaxis protein
MKRFAEGVPEQRLFALFMQAPTAIVLLRGPAYVIEAVNSFACQLWGRPYDGVIDRPLFEVLPEIRDQGFKELLDAVYHTGVPHLGNETVAMLDPLGDGTIKTVYLNFVYTPFRHTDGAITGVFVVASDVTDQVQARQTVQQTQDRLTFALDAADVGYWDLDLVSYSATRSLSHDRIFGYSALLPVWTFEMFLGHVEPSHRVSVEDLFQRAITAGVDWHFECPIIAGDGGHRWIEGHGRSERSSDGAPARMLGIVLDVTERRALIAREREARVDAERETRAKDEFLAMLGHELRNPLAPILAALQLMRLKGVVGADKERAVIERQIAHVVRLVDDLLDVSRITQGKIDMQKAHVEIGDIVTRALEIAAPLIAQKRHTLDVDIPLHGLAVHGDAMRLAQVVSNLLTNAAKYTEAIGRISVRAASEGREVVLTIRDTGIGISPDLLPYVFDLFVQERQPVDRSEGGLGLGLAIARSLVTLHGGTVSAHSDGKGRGSTFVVRLPMAVSSLAELTAVETAAVEPLPWAMPGARILIVDDNEDAADMLVEALAAKGHQTRIAHDGPAALRVCAEFLPSFALLDIGLPGMDGYELAGHLRALDGMRHVVLVAVTGYGQAADRQRTQAAGFDYHLVKPIDLAALDEVIRTATTWASDIR